jgi:predicted SAM-dependent methyltransferase
VYASHILEHLTLDDFHRALDQTKKILQARGIFRLVIPDLEWAAREYVTRLETGDPTANNFFLNATCLGKEARRHGLTGFVYNLLRKAAQWMWDELSLEYALEKHGFIRIRKCSFGDCEDPMFALVEDRGRFEHAIAMEARVPQHDSR